MQTRGPAIRALIFDMGGVLVRTASQESRLRLARKLGLSLDELYDLVFNSEESLQAQLGSGSPEGPWQRIARQFGFDQEQLAAFQRDMFGADELDSELIDYIRCRRQKYKTALLSNASAGLERRLRDDLHIDDCFDVIVISALVGIMKPDPAIYHLVLRKLGVAPEEAVFIDDSPENVAGAAAVGIHAIRFTTREAVLKQLEQLLAKTARSGCDTPGGAP